MRPLIIAGLLILALILGKFLFFTDKPDKASPGGGGGAGKKSAPHLNTVVVDYEESASIISTSGSTLANDHVEIRSEISGIITRLNIPEGTLVQKGFLIAKIKDDDILAQLKKIELEEALAAQTEARHRKLLDINAISKEEYEISQNKVLTLQADKDLLKVQLSRTEIRAPFSGKLSLKNISLGAYVTPANVITTLTQYNPIKIDFTAPERYINDIHVGSTIRFKTDGSAEVYTARVAAIDPTIDASLRTLKVRALAQNPQSTLIPGMFVNVTVDIRKSRSIMVPTEAVIPVVDGMEVFVKRNGKAEIVKVETGFRDVSKVEVLKGLNVGDTLITSGLITLKAGDPVASN
ncbi:MAG: efflux RND transporter periplasmic adaptor subunit [Leadbetterella sp.]|nr:efflux RND transporter periplasmic adaptor subunit [Leadbetterella sp.]